MTTICTDGIAIAAEGRQTAGNQIVSEKASKLHRMPDGSVIGEAGTCTSSLLALQELADSIVEDRQPKLARGDYTLLQLHENGRVTVYWGELVGLDIPTPAAIGSGADFALGAMHAGSCAREAVRIAKKLDRSSGGRIQCLIPRKPA